MLRRVCDVTIDGLVSPAATNKTTILHATSEVQLYPLTTSLSMRQYNHTIGLKGQVTPASKILTTRCGMRADVTEFLFETVPLTMGRYFASEKKKRQFAAIFDARNNASQRPPLTRCATPSRDRAEGRMPWAPRTAPCLHNLHTSRL